MEISYKQAAKEFTVAGAVGATGLSITSVLVVPENVVTWALDDATTLEEIASLDIYMGDFGYVRVF